MKISLLMLSLDRYEMTVHTFHQNLKHAQQPNNPGFELELLVCDNGSKDKRMPEYWRAYMMDYFRENQANEGVGKAFNQLYLRSTGDLIVLMGNDILMPPGWLAEMVKYATQVPRSGLIGVDWGHGGVPPISAQFGINAHWLNGKYDRVFGTTMVRRQVIEQVGLFYEGYGPYGLEDSDLNERVNRAAFNSCYVPNIHFRSQHLDHDVGSNTEYRRMKDKSLADNLAIFHERVAQFDKGNLSTPLPPLRSPYAG